LNPLIKAHSTGIGTGTGAGVTGAGTVDAGGLGGQLPSQRADRERGPTPYALYVGPAPSQLRFEAIGGTSIEDDTHNLIRENEVGPTAGTIADRRSVELPVKRHVASNEYQLTFSFA
jgi:hypothetical protein